MMERFSPRAATPSRLALVPAIPLRRGAPRRPSAQWSCADKGVTEMEFRHEEKYRAIYRVADARVGVWSDEVSITVGG